MTARVDEHLSKPISRTEMIIYIWILYYLKFETEEPTVHVTKK